MAIPVGAIDTTGIPVGAIDTTKKRGRPVSGCALSQRERDRRYRVKKRFMAAVAEMRCIGLDPLQALREGLQ